MPQARISMRSIHHKRAFSKELVLSAFADKLTTRGFRVDHPETIELQRHEIADDYMTVVQILSGRVPNDNQQLTGFVYHIKAAWRQIQQLQEDGDFENKAYDVAQRALNVMGQMHKWLEQQGDDRADIEQRRAPVQQGKERPCSPNWMTGISLGLGQPLFPPG